MKLYEILENIDIQCDKQIVWYDYIEEERIFTNTRTANELRVLYMYIENDTLFIEVENPND